MLLLSALRVSGLDLWVRRLSRCLGLGVILFSRFFLQGRSWSVTDRIWSHPDARILTYFSLFLISLTYFLLSLRFQVSHKGLTSPPLSLCLLFVPIFYFLEIHTCNYSNWSLQYVLRKYCLFAQQIILCGGKTPPLFFINSAQLLLSSYSESGHRHSYRLVVSGILEIIHKSQ